MAYNDPTNIWRSHKSYLLCEAVFIAGAIVMFFHCKMFDDFFKRRLRIYYRYLSVALKQGGRWPFLYFAAIFHGFTVEFMAYFFPHIDNFWHAQGVFTFVERRLPLYVVFLCRCSLTIDYASEFEETQFDKKKLLRSCLLLPIVLGNVKIEIKVWLCRVFGCWSDDCFDRYAVRHYRS